MTKILITETQLSRLSKKIISEQFDGDLGYIEDDGLSKKERKAKRKKEKSQSKASNNWMGQDSGTIIFGDEEMERFPIAVNVGFEKFDLRYTYKVIGSGESEEEPKPAPTPPEETTPTPKPPDEVFTIEDFTVMGTGLPYADNMVMPYFSKKPKSQEQFNKIVNGFVKYINAGGGDKLTNVTIKGSADSAAPTETVPSGYGTELDHPGGKPWFGGIPASDLKKRNQWLADNRAKQYANALITAIKEKTGFDLKIEVLPGDNYYGQQGKRGPEFRKITLKPNAPEHKKVSSAVKTGSEGKKEQTPQPVSKNLPPLPTPVSETKVKNITINLPSGKIATVKGLEKRNQFGDKVMVTSVNNGNALNQSYGIPKEFDGNMSGRIGEDLNFYVGGKLMGKIKPIGQMARLLTTMNYAATGKPKYYVGPLTTIGETLKYGDDTAYTSLKDVYFTFT